LKTAEKWRRWKGKERAMEGVEQMKVKYTHRRNTLRNLFEH
jgi:hypothetical protein